MPPQVPPELDSSWDDDTMPRLELDDPMSESAFDRVTQVPELPAEQYAKQLMSQQQEDGPADAFEQLPRLSSEPPFVSVPPSDATDSTPTPRAGTASSPDPAVPSQNSVTARPGRNRAPLGAATSALELADLAPPTTSRGPTAAESRYDPRDPVLELDLGEVARSGPPPLVLVASPAASARDGQITKMKDRYAMGDFTGALVVAEGMLEVNADDIDAQRYAQSCRDVLMQMYSARLGSLTQRVRVAVPSDQIRWLSLDHRAGFVLSLIDGSSTVEELLDISGMNRLDALRILYTLYDQRVVALG
jgi:hypothetical protein